MIQGPGLGGSPLPPQGGGPPPVVWGGVGVRGGGEAGQNHSKTIEKNKNTEKQCCATREPKPG